MGDVENKIVAAFVVDFSKFLGKAAYGWLEDHRERRRERLERLGYRTGNILNIAGITPEPVLDKIAVPILQAASLEDDETLQEKWAGLLASAADPASREWVHPSFPEILRSLSPQEAKFLDACCDEVLERGHGDNVLGTRQVLHWLYANIGLTRLSRPALSMGDFSEHPEEARADTREFSVTLEHLTALKLLDVESQTDMKTYVQEIFKQIDPNPFAQGGKRSVSIQKQPSVAKTYFVTGFGIAFVLACRGPRPSTTS